MIPLRWYYNDFILFMYFLFFFYIFHVIFFFSFYCFFSFVFFFSSRRRHTRLTCGLEFRRVLFRSGLSGARASVAPWRGVARRTRTRLQGNARPATGTRAARQAGGRAAGPPAREQRGSRDRKSVV